jgi:hypothetical protein
MMNPSDHGPDRQLPPEPVPSAPPICIAGQTLRLVRLAGGHLEWRSEDQRFRVWSNGLASTFSASAAGALVGRRFRRVRTAFRAAIKRDQRGT